MSKTKLGFSTGKGYVSKVAKATNAEAVNDISINYKGSDSAVVVDEEYIISKKKCLVNNDWNSPQTCINTGVSSSTSTLIISQDFRNKVIEIVFDMEFGSWSELTSTFTKSFCTGINYLKLKVPATTPSTYSNYRGELYSGYYQPYQSGTDSDIGNTLEILVGYSDNTGYMVFSTHAKSSNSYNACRFKLYRIYEIIEEV